MHQLNIFLLLLPLSSYLIDRYSSVGFPTLKVPHCADLVSARAANKHRQTITHDEHVALK